MSRHKIIRWLDHQNEKVCLGIAGTYYRKVEGGKTALYIIHPRFWPLLVLRLFTGLIQLLRFNKVVLTQFKFTAKDPVSNKVTFKDLFLSLAGVKHFTNPVYTPAYYAKRVNELRFTVAEKPLVSIIIPVFNQVDFTLTCLRSLYLNLPDDIATELIIADDASDDATEAVLSKIEGLNYIRNIENIGFLKNCNHAMDRANGTFICLLNNDTIVQEGWLENLLQTLQGDETVGCAGSKLIYPYGLLQEAGGVIFDNAAGLNYGKFKHPVKHLYNFTRQVDYCSGASLMFRKADVATLGYFDEQYCPAYYEDADLCFAITNQLKKKVVYVSTSVVVHFEGISSGKRAKKGNVKSYQEINRQKFLEKWKPVLSDIKNADDAARRYLPAKTILVIDNNLPMFDRDSGSNRMQHLLNIFKQCGYHVLFVPKDGLTPQPYFNILTNNGVEVIQNYVGSFTQKREIIRALPAVNVAWLCRPKVTKKFAYIFSYKNTIKWVYDTVDLHYIRLLREAELMSKGSGKHAALVKRSARYFKLEMALAKKADITIAITDVEATELRQNNIQNVAIVPNIHVLKQDTPAGRANRYGILFIGNFKHQPNEDAVNWLVKDIMPGVWRNVPEANVFIVGSNPTEAVVKLASERVVVTGFVKDADPYFNSAKVFVAPLRYGAGMKGKIGQALEYALPIVSTSIGTEGMGLVNNVNVIEANTVEDFSNGIITLLADEAIWTRLSENSASALRPFSFDVQKDNIAMILEDLTN